MERAIIPTRDDRVKDILLETPLQNRMVPEQLVSAHFDTHHSCERSEWVVEIMYAL
jgi:hypothetical protein